MLSFDTGVSGIPLTHFTSAIYKPYATAWLARIGCGALCLLIVSTISNRVAAAELEVVVTDLDGRVIPGVATVLHDVPAAGGAGADPIDGNNRIEIDQIDEQFVPLMSVIPRGSNVWFPNSDNVRHHVYSFSEAKPFELSLYHADEAPPVVFGKTGIVLLGCNIHDSMRAAVLVTEQAVYGVTDEHGRVRLQYQAKPTAAERLIMSLWHEQLGAKEALETQLEVARVASGSVTATLPIRFKPVAPQSISDLKSRLQGYRKGSSQQ
ncbi:methylamine utilization protein [Allohahella sp. A8]|uniref:methylamine utilization protein n=1 Tax=Allohahella sp. A8 TaxID=3141461 RepID=UPI003A7FF73D